MGQRQTAFFFCRDTISRDYLKSWGSEWWKSAPNELVSIYENQIRTPERQDVVILQKVLADKVNQGYHEYENHVVAQIDGVAVRNMLHLVALVEGGSGTFVTVGLHDGQRIVLERTKAIERCAAILDRYNVRFDRSLDLRATKREAAKRPRSSKG